MTAHEQLDAAPANLEHAVAEPHHVEALRAGRPVDDVLGLELGLGGGEGRPGGRPRLRKRLEDRGAQLLDPRTGRGRRPQHANRLLTEAIAPLRNRPLGVGIGHQVPLREHHQLR